MGDALKDQKPTRPENRHYKKKPFPPGREVDGAREPREPQASAEESLFLYGRNPVKEAIKSGRSIDKILVVDSEHHDGSLREILGMARERHLVIIEMTRPKLDDFAARYADEEQMPLHQGIMALLPAIEYVEIEDILDAAKEAGHPPFVLILDSIQDPHNFGAILRSAEAVGVDGIIIPKRRAVSVTGTVAKASAGAVLYSRIARVANLSQAVETLKKAGVWIAGAEMDGDEMEKAPLEGAIALIVGNEGEGISPLLKKNCDFLVSIPMQGQLNSLNASIAAAVLMYEKRRQDRASQ